MTTVLAVYEGGVLRPVHPLPFGDGEDDWDYRCPGQIAGDFVGG